MGGCVGGLGGSVGFGRLGGMGRVGQCVVGCVVGCVRLCWVVGWVGKVGLF